MSLESPPKTAVKENEKRRLIMRALGKDIHRHVFKKNSIITDSPSNSAA